MKPKQYKSRHVSCACTEEERLAVQQNAKREGKSTSEYLRGKMPAEVWTTPRAAGPPGGRRG